MLAWVRWLVAFVVIAAAASAQAEWRLSAGPTATIIFDVVEPGTSVLFGCADGTLAFGVNNDVLGPLPEEAGDASLSIQIDGGLRWESSATYRRTKTGGFDVVYGKLDDIPAILNGLIDAQSTVVVGLEHHLYGERFSWTAGAKGSTKAGRELVEKCGIAMPSSAPAAAKLTWETTIGPDPVNGGEQASLLADLENNTFLFAYCDSQGATSLSLLGNLPYEVGDVGLSLQLQIDGESRTTTGEYFTHDNGISGVNYTGDYVANSIKAIADARVGVRMKVQDYSDDSLREFAALDMVGHRAATDAFNAKCFGMAPAPSVADSPAALEPVPAAPEPVVRSTTWTVERGPGGSVPGAAAALLGATSPAPGFMQIACFLDWDEWSVAFASAEGTAFPVSATDGPFRLLVTLGGDKWAFEDARLETEAGRTSVVKYGVADVAGLAIALQFVFDPFTLTIVTASGAEHRYTLATDGLGEASRALAETCMGPT
jgi:hypothetical protein